MTHLVKLDSIETNRSDLAEGRERGAFDASGCGRHHQAIRVIKAGHFQQRVEVLSCWQPQDLNQGQPQ